MYSRLFVLFAAIMALALLVAANPVPNQDGVLVKKALKQYDMKRAIANAKARREGHPTPSPHHRREGHPTPSPTHHRRDGHPTPSPTHHH